MIENCNISIVENETVQVLTLSNDILYALHVENGDTVLNCSLEKVDFNCQCTGNVFDPTLSYNQFDVVEHNGSCWEALAQGRGITPGPWLVNGNDIWIICEE